jgi:hypothetical protein
MMPNYQENVSEIQNEHEKLALFQMCTKTNFPKNEKFYLFDYLLIQVDIGGHPPIPTASF